MTTSTPTAVDTLISDFPSVVSFPVLWGDMDAFQHVNNTASIRWFESSRIRLIEHPLLSARLKAEGVAPILASVSCSYRRQLRYPDTVHVGSRVSKLGNTSLTLEHALVSEQLNCVASEGASVVVCFDYKTQRPVRISDELRDAVERIQGAFGSR
jgi:acyl-CoA thioester hydrolase